MVAVAGQYAEREETFSSVLLEHLFARCFRTEFNTLLEGGFEEPLYTPPDVNDAPGSIRYRRDYFASALHEVAHWCIAGPHRRSLVDYGYWYAPDGRSVVQQADFEQVECKPQALEWFFAKACGYVFTVSVDNLDSRTGEIPETSAFRKGVLAQALHWQEVGLPCRAQSFCDCLYSEFRSHDSGATGLQSLNFSLEELS